MAERMGATIAEWQWAIANINAGQDLLPAVGDPSRLVRRHRKIKDDVTSLAKIPSSIDRHGVCHRISDWADRKRITTREQLEHWAAIPELNILMLTRDVRVIDIDVEDMATADGIEKFIVESFGIQVPVRWRANSAKRSLLFRIEPHVPLNKRVVKVGGGSHKIEFLADGQQTLLFGTHPSGARMQLRGHELGIPSIPFDTASRVWDSFVKHYSPSSKPFYDIHESTRRSQMLDSGAVVSDPVLDYLVNNGHVVEFDSAEKVVVRCPWEHEHTTSDSSTATIWGVATENREGYFKCLHGHCEHRNTRVFLEEIGYTDYQAKQDFAVEVYPTPATIEHRGVGDIAVIDENNDGEGARYAAISKAVVAPLPGLGLLRNPKTGKMTEALCNLNEILREDTSVVDVRYDSFTTQMAARIGGTGGYVAVDDDVLTMLREIVERRYGVSYSASNMSAALSMVAKANTDDSAIAWLRDQQWDGVPRIDAFARDILGSVEGEYGVALSRYLWASMAARIMLPGCKADMSVVLVSPGQGTGKSSLVMSLAPKKEWYELVDLELRDADLSRLIRGRAIMEMAELNGLRGRDAESIKAWMTKASETWVPKYKEFSTTYDRRCIFVGTTNQTRFLRDASGNRRWLPIRVALTKKHIDWPSVAENINQYWAEALTLIGSDIQNKLDAYARAATLLAEPARIAATILDENHDAAKSWLASQPPGARVTTRALRDALGMNGRYDGFRAENILQMLGWEEVDGSNDWISKNNETFIL